MSRPNILFITYDQMRYDCVGASHIRPVKTPNIDRIADNGAYFENCYTPMPVCCPARQSMLTAKRPEQLGALWNHHGIFPVKHITPETPNFVNRLVENGYNAEFIGSWEADPENSPLAYGYKKFISKQEIQKKIDEKYPDVKYTNSWFGCENPVPLEDSFTHTSAKIVINELEELSKSEKPFFLHIDNTEPHLPVRPSYPFSNMYNPDEIERWGTLDDTYEGKPYIHKQQTLNWGLEGKTWEDWKYTVALYYGLVSQYDDALGRILDKVEELGIAENTIIVYTCDHGDMCGSHGYLDKHICMYEDILHIPLAIRWDGHIKKQRYDAFCYQCLDVPPTIMNLAGIPLDFPNDGKDLSEYMLNGGDDGRDFAVSAYNGMQFGLMTLRSITTKKYKYVWNLTDIDELYDLEIDPYELHNLIYDEDKKNVIADLRKKLYYELQRCHDCAISCVGRVHLLVGKKI